MHYTLYFSGGLRDKFPVVWRTGYSCMCQLIKVRFPAFVVGTAVHLHPEKRDGKEVFCSGSGRLIELTR